MISYFDGRWFVKPDPVAPSVPIDTVIESEQYVADESLSALRVVRAAGPGRVCYARPPELEARAPLGITNGAAASGEPITLISRGEMRDASWSWTPGETVLLGPNGTLTQAQPSGQPYLVVVAVAVSATAIVVRIGLPIFVDGL